MRRVLVACLVLRTLPVAADDSIAKDAAASLLYDTQAVPACADIDCLIEHRYASDTKAKKIALDLFHAAGDVAGVGADQIMDGSYRGRIHLVPELPIGRYRNHLVWVADAMASFDAFFAAQFPGARPNYRWHALGFQFVRSLDGKRTPSAAASSWSIEYNVAGSLLTSSDGVRETLFHEIYHLNDEAHGDWSARTLATDYNAIVRKCGTKVSCLAPYAPNDTMVRGGTYYAFQPNNGDGVHEYAAELAVRYWKEQREMQAKHRLSAKAFKCGPAENARAWKALVDEYFAGRDLVPAC